MQLANTPGCARGQRPQLLELLTYHEPAFRGQNLAPEQWQQLEPGLCPIAESLQPQLLQFKTNYFEPDRADHAATILAKTIAYFD